MYIELCFFKYRKRFFFFRNSDINSRTKSGLQRIYRVDLFISISTYGFVENPLFDLKSFLQYKNLIKLFSSFRLPI